MQRSRNLWILLITLACLAGMLAWKSPQTVMSALAHPAYADSPRVAVEHFWHLMDSREIATAEEMFTGNNSAELRAWIERVEKNPLLSLRNVEFLNTSNARALEVRVSWLSPPQAVQSEKYSFVLEPHKEGWRIVDFRPLR
ncbi:Prokaryotic membrane lipoprotein lipid attachment site profile [Acididesulfobacillus acetoxydans]|uniref:Prokaryotic membrane lipoprotein lipid attachment site profile n=1 Tax=Acididesulfobacillus acetoxydans TaxID=1561005 RepID=A0A8S0WXX1_9FIRM|nr:hypothetical protein [Acididesulfobacillus acetoxydans]CAA7601181.1 Prokaryotic membrane lipoprotein lipid attachment site profile [Acididesulfobacillus acetoxydans]CEJ08540.1 Prokaryotic membrane lipoprotein lipid attachment site profile [Acididesulfobacillus acetoxydans]